MKLLRAIGLIGGMSWQPTAHYYSMINEGVKARLGGLHSAKILLHSVDFGEIEPLQRSGDWGTLGRLLSAAASGLEGAGADCVVLCTNTMHKVAKDIERSVSIPFLHIADATACEITARKISKVGLIGTKYTMDEDFYRGRLEEKFGLSFLVPEKGERELINRVIFEELCLGKVKAESKCSYVSAIRELEEKGAQGIILGCTEIGMLITQKDTRLPVFDTTALHAKAAVAFALS